MLLDHGCHRACLCQGWARRDVKRMRSQRAIRRQTRGRARNSPEATSQLLPRRTDWPWERSVYLLEPQIPPVKIKIKPPVLCHTAHRQGDSHHHGCHMDDVKAPLHRAWFPQLCFPVFCHWSMGKVCIFIHDLWPLSWTLSLLIIYRFRV